MSRSQWSHLYANRRWRKLRADFLAKNPLCAYCLKMDPPKVTKADVVDHVVPHKGDMVKFWAGPFQALCSTHHSSAKAREDAAGEYIGCDEKGNPNGRADW